MNPLFSILPQFIAKQLDALPPLEKIFSDPTIAMLPVVGKHIGLLSSDNLSSHGGAIVGVWVQAIDDVHGRLTGRVVKHDHGNEGITEVIITEGDTVYAGLPAPIAHNSTHTLYLVPAGTRHGSNTQPSYGRWVSIKIKL